MEKNCPITKIISILGEKWTLLILKQLSGVPDSPRFSDLLVDLAPISSRTLSKRLKTLEKAGLIKKQKFNELPPRVEYSLTPSGKELIKCFVPLAAWAKKFG